MARHADRSDPVPRLACPFAAPFAPRVMRRFLFVLFASLTAVLQAQMAQPEVTADVSDSDFNQKIYTLKGHAVYRDKDNGLLMTADLILYEVDTGMATATGNVRYTRRSVRLLADKVVFQRRDNTFTAEHVRLGSYPYYVQGQSADGVKDEITVHQARVSYGEPGPWQPTATAEQITISAENGKIRRIHSEHAQVGIGHAQVLPFPKFEQSISEPFFALMTLTGGYRGTLGPYIDAGLHLPVTPWLRLGGDVGYYTKRGLMVGPSGSYSNPTDPELLLGSFRSGYINDHGDKGVDLLGRAVPENRGYVEWQHRQVIGENLTLTGQLNWWKDSEVVRDFRPRSFYPVQQPDSFLEATYANPNSFVSVFTRFEPNSFEIVQQRTPEIRFDVLPVAIGGGLYERFNGSIVMLHESPIATLLTPASVSTEPNNPNEPDTWTTRSELPIGSATELRSTRLDGYYSLTRPITPNDWLTVTPVAGGRLTHYMNTAGAAQTGGYTRALGEIGADAELRTSGTFNYKNEAWHIDGLRHLFTPRLSYRYIPEANKGAAYIPPIDRDTFSTYLPALGLGEARNVDTLHATNTLRLGFDNTLQTRDAKYSSRDLLTFNVANDFRFKRQHGERDVSEIHTELAAMPANWVEFGFYNSFSPRSFSLREFNTGVTFRDGNLWSVQFANNFLRRELQDYSMNARMRVNEQFDALALLRYDQNKHRFTEQSYGIVQNLANTWRVSYLISFYSGRRRESGFGLSVQIDTVRF